MTQRSFIYSLVRAPEPPTWLLERALSAMHDSTRITQADMANWSRDSTERTLHDNGKIYENAFNHSCFLDQECHEWARENITHNIKDVRIAFTKPQLERCGAHVDRTRDYTLIYLLQTGGDAHRTVFYREKGQQELLRPRAYHVDDYANLDPVSEVVLQTRQWNLVQAQILHSIENIPLGRVSIQISLDDPLGLHLVDPIFI